MIELYREHLRRVRRRYDVFVIPSTYAVSGEAFTDGKNRFITISGSVHSQLWLFVLYHEAAHHHFLHVGAFNTLPAWIAEYQADMAGLEAVRKYQPYAFRKCEADAKTHIRRIVQWYIDNDFCNHVDVDVANWAECDMTNYRDPESDDDNF